MRKIADLGKKVSLFGLGLVFILVTGCNPIKKMQKDLDKVKVEIQDEVLEVHADSINVFFNAKIPEKYFNKRAIMKLEPILVYDQDSVFLEPFFIAGEKVDFEVNKISPKNSVSYENGGLVNYKNRVKYEPGMKNSIIYIVTSYKIDSEYDELDVCVCDIKETKLSEGVVTTSLLAQNNESVEFALEKGNKDGGSGVIEIIEGGTTGNLKDKLKGDVISAKGAVYYQKDKAEIGKTQTTSKDFNIPFVLDPVKDLALKNGMEFTGISTISQASPDGAFERNKKLAELRKDASFKFITKYLGDAGFTAIYDSAFYRPKATYEDWDGLKALINSSNLATKQDIIKIINSNLELDEKEENIKKLVGDNWDDVLAKEILPQLRKTSIALTAKTKIRDIAELTKLINAATTKEARAEALKQLNNRQEYLLLAYYEEDLDKKLEIYEAYKELYPDEFTGDNNIAGTYLLKGEIDKALGMLEPLAKKYPDTKEIINNIGVCYRLKGDYDTAKVLYAKAESLGVDERNNKGIVNIKTADYDVAVTSFEQTRYDFNRALAYTLNKDYVTAKTVVEKIEDKTAEDFYLRAIIGARSKDVDLMTTSLSRAIKLDSSIRQRAKEDLEFRHYWDKPEFENAIR